MSSNVDIRFVGLERDPSIEAAIRRWVVRFETMRLEVARASVVVEPSWLKRTKVHLTLIGADGIRWTTGIVHADAYVAVGDAFRDVRRQVLEAHPRASRRLAFA